MSKRSRVVYPLPEKARGRIVGARCGRRAPPRHPLIGPTGAAAVDELSPLPPSTHPRLRLRACIGQHGDIGFGDPQHLGDARRLRKSAEPVPQRLPSASGRHRDLAGPILTERVDQAFETLGAGYHSARQQREADGQGITTESRWPIGRVLEIDLHAVTSGPVGTSSPTPAAAIATHGTPPNLMSPGHPRAGEPTSGRSRLAVPRDRPRAAPLRSEGTVVGDHRMSTDLRRWAAA